MTPTRLLAAAVVLLIAGGIGAFVAYDQFLRGDRAAELTLPSAQPSATATGGASAAPEGALDAASAGGDWIVASGEAGYRVREQLASLPAESDAVGRTTAVTGSVTLAAAGETVQLTAATIDVDTTSIVSDESRRDDRMRSQGLETDRFPTAGFVLTSPVEIPATAFDGEIVDVTLAGDLTLHGVTRAVSIPAKAQVSGETISVQGSISFPLSDFDIVAPNIGGFIVSIADSGVLEFVVTLARG